ncbi:MAG: glycerol-3-phosphate 1-O-acyltransferase PlsY [Sneathiellaceae bacterium]
MPDPISWDYVWKIYLIALAGGYLLGSVPFGMILTRLFRAGDLRKIGSGSIGATNVLRTGRKDLAAATVLLDAGKGLAAVLIAQAYGPDPTVFAALGALLGHLFPVWLRFRGGKGVATYFGILFGLAWPAGLAAGALWILLAATFRFSSLASLVAALVAPFYLWLWSSPQNAELGVVIAVLIYIRHASNIRRLLAGTESRIGEKKPPADGGTEPSGPPG